MTQMKLSVIDEQLTNQIIDEAMQLLADPGVRVHNQDALELLAQAGANVDFESQIARIPEKLVRSSVATAPKEFYLYDLEGKPAIRMGGDSVHFDPGSTAVYILDGQTGEQRAPNTQDFVKYVKLVETLPQIDAQSTAFVCRDVAEEIGDLYRLYIALNYMRKPIITGAFGISTWWVMWEMLMALAGGERELSARPIAVFDICPTPPLLWSDLTCQNLIDCARKGVPSELVSMPLAGATSPVTLAAAVIQHAAESLSGVTIGQLAHPGSPIVWGGAPAAFDMREGTTPMGDVNTWLIDLAYIGVGKSLGLPTHTYMGSSDAKLLDIQAGLESSGGTFLAALSGANMISGAGMVDFLRGQSFEKLVIDAEIIGMAKRLLVGVEVRDQPIAVDLMRKSAHKANFLSQPHTHKWFRKELHIPSDVIDRGSLDAWHKKGDRSAEQRAHERVDALLKSYQPSMLSDQIRHELRAITLRAARQFGMNDLPALPD
jgi:trimethylamine---corrinoid protein Co-methyltransferase